MTMTIHHNEQGNVAVDRSMRFFSYLLNIQC